MKEVESKVILECIKQIKLFFWIKYMLGGNEYILCSQWENRNHKFGYSNQINLQF